MKKIAVWISIISLILLGGVGILYGYAAKRDFFFDEINALVKQETGYTLTKPGALEFSLLPNPTLIARQLVVTNTSLQSQTTLGQVKSLSLELQWSPLLNRKIIVDLELDSADVSLAIDSQGKSSWMTEELQTVAGGLPFGLDRINGVNTRFIFRNHQTNEILGFDLDKVDMELSKGISHVHIDSAGRFGGSRFYALGDVEYQSETRKLDLMLAVGAGEARDTKVATIKASSTAEWVKQNRPSFPLDGVVKGSIFLTDGVPRGELEIKAEIASLDMFAYLAEPMKYLQTGLGPVSTSGILELTGSDLDITNVQIRLDHQQLDMEASGNIQNLLSDVKFNLDLKAKAKNPGAVIVSESVAGFAGEFIAGAGAVDINASISREEGNILVSGLDLGFSHDSFAARIGGDLQLAEDDITFDLEFQGESDDATDLFKLLNIDESGLFEPGLADFGSLNIAARVSRRQGGYKIDQASVLLQNGNISATLTGSIGIVDSELTFDLDSSLDIRDFSHLVGLFPEELEPDLPGLAGSAKSGVKGTLADFSLSNMEIDLSDKERQLHLRGQLSHLPNNLTSNTDLQFISNRPIELKQYFPRLTDLQLTGPVDLVATIKNRGNKIQIEKIQFQAMDTEVSGDVAIDLGQEPPGIRVELKSGQFSTTLVEIDPEVVNSNPEIPDQANGSEQKGPDSEAKAELSGKELGEMFRAFTAGIGIETAWVNDLDLYFNLTADRAHVGSYDVEDLVLTIDASNGVFSLVRYDVMLDGDPITYSGSIDTNSSPPVYKLSGELKGDSLESLLKVDENLLEGGDLSGSFAFTSKGDDLGALIENLDGAAMITMGPLTIRSSILTTVSADVLSSILRGIVRKKDDEPVSYYQCGVLAVDVVKGVATAKRTFTLQANEYNLAGKGEIDLNTGFVDIAVYPKARKGIGFSISTLVGGFRIKGHLATPDFSLGGGGLVTAAIAGYALAPSLAAASSTNPVTATIVFTGFVAKGFFDRLTASSYTCEKTIKRIERQRAKKSSKNQSEEKMGSQRSIDRVPPAHKR